MPQSLQDSGISSMPTYLQLLLLALCLCGCRSQWCYTEDQCGPATWASLGSCNGSSQSPINIQGSSTYYNSSLGSFQFIGYNNSSKLLTLTNTGHTVEGAVGDGVSVSAGGLPTLYTAIAFHFHWGNGTLGSEHRLAGKQFPMEMHIVHIKAGLNLTQAKQDPTGIAVLAFFIDIMESANSSKLAALADLLTQVSNPGSSAPLNAALCLDDLLSGADRSAFYRYSGSLTTPTCDQAVLWSVFSNPIYVPSRVLQAFATAVRHNSSGSLETLVNNFRPPQPIGNRQVQASFTSTATPTATSASPSPGTRAATATVTPSSGTNASTATVTPSSGTKASTATVTPSSGTNASTATVTPSSGADRSGHLPSMLCACSTLLLLLLLSI